jgi:hypothetical protein
MWQTSDSADRIRFLRPSAIERDGRVLARIGLRGHFLAEGEDSHARKRRGRVGSALLAASIGRHRPGFRLHQRFAR